MKRKNKTVLTNGLLVKIKDNSKTPSKEWDSVMAGVGAKAVKDTFSQGYPVTIGEDNKLIKLYPNGDKEIIGEL